MAKRKIKAEFALRDICSRYPCINKMDIENFGPVYYPVARIEVDMQEKSFEDFDAVQESVLRFVSIGFREEEVIANLMGLTASYIRDMLKLLVSYGHIDNNRNITSLGSASLAEGQKITIANTRQVFLLDALNCNIIRIDRDLDRTIIEKPDDMTYNEKHIAFLEHAAGISKSDVEATLKDTEYKTLRRMQGGMNINVTNVSDVRCLGIRYIKSYLLKLKNHTPMIFVKRFDYTGTGSERFYWLPFSVRNPEERAFLGLTDLQIHSSQTDAMISDAYVRMIERAASEHVVTEIDNKFEFFTKTHFKIDVERRGMQTTVSAASFTEYTNNALRLLAGFGRDEVFPLVDDELSGRVIFIYPDKGDSLLTECSKYVHAALTKHTYDKVVSYIEQRMDKDGNVIQSLLSVLKKLLD
ncbi:MAG: hypothetical protein IJ454_04405 [Clostridia bacterium]|nr:hypothetical protein [Clostridia bacterium]